jgi:UDP-glucose 4-epimerase
VAIFSNLIIANQSITIFGSGEQTRDYVFVGDVVAANMLVSEAELSDGTGIDDRAFNVGTGTETSVNQLARELMSAAGRDVPVEHAAGRPGELQWNSLQTVRLKELGWKPTVSLAEGLERTYRWIAERAE